MVLLRGSSSDGVCLASLVIVCSPLEVVRLSTSTIKRGPEGTESARERESACGGAAPATMAAQVLRKVSIGGWTRCPYFQKAANVAAAMEHLYPT